MLIRGLGNSKRGTLITLTNITDNRETTKRERRRRRRKEIQHDEKRNNKKKKKKKKRERKTEIEKIFCHKEQNYIR